MASANLPESLVEDILSRLPVKSLKRFVFVNKSWSTLFQNPGFIAKHHHYFSQKNLTLLVSHRDCITKNSVLSSHPVSNDNGSLDLNMEIPFFNDDMQELNILCACINGVICLYDHPFLISNQHPNDDLNRIALWNPAIKEFKEG
ncbi:f-box/lrr-repeat/kelch-repeat protein [Quercus suber]|uniref:F-box/lrr-repeat/kelch-repeat protein n=1 Tax=Quercus suber TaxID=58331 RepID=A0AAW0L868_QUESU